MGLQHALGSSIRGTLENRATEILDNKMKPRGGASFAALLSAFVPTWTTAILFIAVFVAIRHRYPKIYSPRTHIGTILEKDRTPSASRSYFDWIHTLRVVPDKFLLYHASIDSYLFLRFLKTLIFICVVGCILTWPILMPINAAGGGTSSQLDKITIGNVVDKKKLYAHAILAWIFFAFVMFTVARERLWLIGLRQAWNISKPNAKRLSSRTVLFLSAPKECLDDQNIQRHFGDDAVHLWPATGAVGLQSIVSDRNSSVEQLESAEMSLITAVNKKKRQWTKNNNNRRDLERTYDNLPHNLKKSLRPSHRVASQPNKKVDSIEYLRHQIKEKESDLEQRRKDYSVGEPQGAAAVFVEFRTLAAAQQAYQQVASAQLLALNPRYAGVLPGEVIWDNLTLPPARRISQGGIATALVVALIVFWFVPVAFVGAVSNVSYLAKRYEWLKFLNNLPDWIMGLLSGLVPPLLTSLLSKYVPNIYRYIFKTFGEPTNTAAELKVLRWYYIFQVVHVFLVTAVASGSASAIPQIGREAAQNPIGIPAILANNLPTSANYYLTYFLVQGLTSGSDNLLNYSDLLQYLFFDYFFDKTPRQKYNSYTQMKGAAWGKLFPKYTNFVIIAIAYSCIAPLVLGFAAMGLAIFYCSYRYMFLYTVQPKLDTKGEAYTLALQHILTGVYIAELSLIGLFSLRQAFGPLIMMAVLLVVTAIYNATMNKYFSPLERFLPVELASEFEDGNAEQTPLLSDAEEGHATDNHLHRLTDQARIPHQIVDPIARFFQPQISTSYRAMRTWLRDGDFDEDDVPEYSDEDLKKAYLNPAFTSPTPVIWIARDSMGVSKHEVGENEKEGLRSSDQGAWLDEKGKLKWSVDDFDEVPIFKLAKKW